MSQVNISVPNTHWLLFQIHTGFAKYSLVLPNSHWFCQKHTGCSKYTLGLSNTHGLCQIHTGCAKSLQQQQPWTCSDHLRFYECTLSVGLPTRSHVAGGVRLTIITAPTSAALDPTALRQCNCNYWQGQSVPWILLHFQTVQVLRLSSEAICNLHCPRLSSSCDLSPQMNQIWPFSVPILRSGLSPIALDFI